MENIDLFSIKKCWGNLAFDYAHSASVGNSDGILCVWDPKSFSKLNATISDYFVMVKGDWILNGTKLLIISIYAPQDLSEKKMLCDYLSHVIAQWAGEVVVMGDFNLDLIRNSNVLHVNHARGLERHLEEMHVTLAQLWKKLDKMANGHEEGLKNKDDVETASRILVMPSRPYSDDVRIFATASGRSRHKKTL
ncbi:RNA-directed DNA polymerase, eukaryota [Tanacetum coccineum]